MCGIAGIVDLNGTKQTRAEVLSAMAKAIAHRGPDESGELLQPGLALASRRLSIIGLKDGRQPIANEDGTVSVVFNGELFDYPEMRAFLESKGHRFSTHCDTELIPHLWEEYGLNFLAHLHGQFAFALWDQRQQQLILARDRFGICPLFWSRQSNGSGDWLLFASEIKALLATGLVEARPDLRGLNHVFTFWSLPGPLTCFQGVQILLPGHYMKINLGGTAGQIEIRPYWEIMFPEKGAEDGGGDPNILVEEFEAVIQRAVERRLRADVPVVSYLSGGVDSSLVVAMATKLRGQPIPTFTIGIQDPHLNETSEATLVARHVGTTPIEVKCGAREILNTFPRFMKAAEVPVLDTTGTTLLLLAEKVHEHGYKVALTGEGSDEWLAGYPWYQGNRRLGLLDFIPGLPLSNLARRMGLWLTGAPPETWPFVLGSQGKAGGFNAWMDFQSFVCQTRFRLFSRQMLNAVPKQIPYEDLNANVEQLRRLHPLHRALYWGARTVLPGLLLSTRGDRVAMHSSVETRYPFLDEEVFQFLARLHPRWKLRGFQNKRILRRVAERWLPSSIAWRPKAIFRASYDIFDGNHLPEYVNQLLSEESLRKTGYFEPAHVHHWRNVIRQLKPGSYRRMSVEMGLVGVAATQLWHHTFIDGSLADL